jgi:hypothetical protein
MIKYRAAIISIGIVLVSSTTGIANVEECRLINKTKERMACFDRLDAANHVKTNSLGALDLLQQENERLGKTVKSICRGC